MSSNGKLLGFDPAFIIIHESALENSHHWDTTEKAIINGGYSTRDCRPSYIRRPIYT